MMIDRINRMRMRRFLLLLFLFVRVVDGSVGGEDAGGGGGDFAGPTSLHGATINWGQGESSGGSPPAPAGRNGSSYYNGSANGSVNQSTDGASDGPPGPGFSVVTRFVVGHVVAMHGIDDGAFNMDEDLVQAFVDTITRLLKHVAADNVRNVFAVPQRTLSGAGVGGGRRSLVTSSSASCDVTYDIVLDSVGKAEQAQSDIKQFSSEKSSPSGGGSNSVFMAAFKTAMAENSVAPSIANNLRAVPESTSTQSTTKFHVAIQTGSVDMGASGSGLDLGAVVTSPSPGAINMGKGKKKPPTQKNSPSSSKLVGANATHSASPGAKDWKKGMRQETFIIIVSAFSGAGVFVALLHGAKDCTAGCCGRPKFRKVRVAKFLDVQLVEGEDVVVVSDADQEQMTSVERAFLQGEENLKAEIAADAEAAHQRLLERLKIGSRRVDGQRRRSVALTDGSSVKAHPLTRRPTETERLRRLHSTNMKIINSQSIFDKDGDGNVDDEDLDVDGDGIVDDTEREMGRLAVQSAESQRAQLRQQEEKRLKSEHRLDARLRQRRRASVAASHRQEEERNRQAQQSSAKVVPVVGASARDKLVAQQQEGEGEGEREDDKVNIT
jgi:hypothetical protein